MTGISEALVATAVGLMVAIPAVLAFNYFQRRRARHGPQATPSPTSSSPSCAPQPAQGAA
jgi:hypothetical protein